MTTDTIYPMAPPEILGESSLRDVPTSDADLRAVLRPWLQDRHANDLIIDEFAIAGEARADLAVIGRYLAGFEIKSARDSLRRLPGQVTVYSRVFDYMTLVVDPAHTPHAKSVIPDWWGILEARPSRAGLSLVTVRRGRRQTNLDRWYLTTLLWREEVLHLLAEHGLDRGLRSKSGSELRAKLVDGISKSALRDGVRHALLTRQDWRPA